MLSLRTASVMSGIGLALTLSLPAIGKTQPAYIQRTDVHSLQNTSVLYRLGDAVLVRSDAASPEDFKDLYVVNTGLRFALPPDIEQFGEVVDFSPARFAVMRLKGGNAAALAARLHGEGHACGLLTKLTGEPIALDDAPTPKPLLPVVNADARVSGLLADVSTDRLQDTVASLASMPTRYHESSAGGGVADTLADKYRELARGRSDVTITTVDHGDDTPQKSLIVRLHGQSRSGEVLVLGSHLDSINRQTWGNDGLAPGADDNASGTAVNMEVFRVLMNKGVHLQRTLEIHAYAAEEVGLVGSQDIANRYRRDGTNVVAMVQHDMVLWKEPRSSDKIWLVSTSTDGGFNDLLAQLAGRYLNIEIGRAPLYGGSSDHASWRRAGFAAAFPFENPGSYNSHIHTAGDTIANSGAWAQATAFAKLAVAFVTHFGGLD